MATKRRASKDKPLSRMLEDPNKESHKTYGVAGLLAKLWRNMLKDRDINGFRYSYLMGKFLEDPRNSVPDNLKDRTSNRGNLNKEFTNPRMSWKVFCKAMRFLQLTGFRFTIEAHHPDGQTTIHSVDVNFEDVHDIYDDDDEHVNLPVPDDQENVPYLDGDDE